MYISYKSDISWVSQTHPTPGKYSSAFLQYTASEYEEAAVSYTKKTSFSHFSVLTAASDKRQPVSYWRND